jgi:large subunit ribosomal protein L4
MNLPIYNTEGKEIEKIELQDEIFSMKWNDDLMHQVVVAMQSNARQPIAHTKDRSEVRGGGKKPWKQKGTGRARHGSIRSPLWVGGGVAHGPRNEKDYSRKINKKVKAKALAMVISQKIRDNEVFLIDGVDLKEPKTKEAKNVLTSIAKIKGLESLNKKRKNAGLIVLSGKKPTIEKSFANFSNLEIDDVKNVSILDLLRNKYFIVFGSKEVIQDLNKRVTVTKK